MRRFSSSWLLLIALGGGQAPALQGCAPAPLPLDEGCSPHLYDIDCGLPYPSDFFVVDDETMPTGKRVRFSGKGKLFTPNGVSADITEVWAPDGFSPNTPIVMSFGVRVDQESVPKLFGDPSTTLQAGAPTALIEAETGRRVAHYVDVDPRAVDDARQAVVMRPLERLKPRTRYVVAMSGVKDVDGVDAPVREGFRRLRDGDVGDDPIVKPLREHYAANVLPVVEKAGIPKDKLQLAWDFTVGSDERPIEDMLVAREIAIAALDETPPVVEIDAVFEGSALEQIVGRGADHTWRLVRGKITGPRVVDSDEAGARLARGPDGKPKLDGTTTFPFIAVIPLSVRDGVFPGQPMLYGHGFFGDRSEIEGEPPQFIANDSHAIAFAIDWQGMSVDDIGEVVAAVAGQVSESIVFGERVMQGMVNWQAVTRAIKSGVILEHDAFLRPKGERAAGAPVVNVDAPLAFMGISQGHVLGGTLSALNADIERSVLHVGGAGLSNLMFRAIPFNRFLFMLDISVPDPLDQQKLHAHMQSHFDRFEPATFARFVVNEDLPIGPSNNASRRRVLVQMGIGDTQVPNPGTEMHARLLGIPQLSGAPVFGLEQADYPARSGFVPFDLGIDPSFYAQAVAAEEETIVHEALRRIPECRKQVATFIQDGVIVDTCGGDCIIDAP